MPALRIDRSGLEPATAALNTVGIVAPLAWGVAVGEAPTGLSVATGALITSFAGLGDPPRARARAMLAAALAGAASTFVSMLTGGTDWLAVVLMAAWAFGGGLLVALGRTAGLVGASIVLAFILVAEFPTDAAGAAVRALAVLGGGLLQTALTAAAWPLEGDRPQRRALASAYAGLAAFARRPLGSPPSTPIAAPIAAADAALARADSRAAAGTPAGAARRGLLDEGERILGELAAVRHLGAELPQGEVRNAVRDGLDRVAASLEAVVATLRRGRPAPAPELAGPSSASPPVPMPPAPGESAGARAELRRRVEALRGELRAADRLAAVAAGAPGASAATRPEAPAPPGLSARAALAANLTLRSVAFRHALRLAGAMAFAVAVYRIADVPHGFWIPLTVLFVLRPDFGSTYSRGLMRAAGTLAGAALAAALAAAAGEDRWLIVALAALAAWTTLTFLFANYVVFTTAITVLIVLVLDLVGFDADLLIRERVVATAIGGAIALASYAVWPTWSGPRLPQLTGDYLAAERAILDAALRGAARSEAVGAEQWLARRRAVWLARGNAEEALRSAWSEPVGHRGPVDAAEGVLAAGRRSGAAALALVAASGDGPARPEVTGLAGRVAEALTTLERSVRAGTRPGPLPDLRAAWKPVAAAGGDPAVARETDRVVDAVDTMAHALADARR